MKGNENNIGNIFKKAFEGHRVEMPESEWLNISTKLTRNNFMKFTPYKFNIYYAVVSSVSVVATAVISINSYFLNTDNNSKTPVNDKNNSVMIYNKESAEIKNNVLPVKGQITDKTGPVILEKDKSVSMNEENSNNDKAENTDGSYIAAKDNTQQTPTVVKSVKKVVEVKGESVEVRDTVIQYEKVKNNKTKKKYIKK